MFRKLIAIALVITITWLSTWAAAPGWAQASSDNDISQKDALKQVDIRIQDLEEIRASIDRSQFDTEVLLETLQYDANQIISFLQNEIHFESYRGVLRGARGTLMSRAGNAFDQAILLANLLKGAGFEARIASGSLLAKQAEILLNQSLPDRTKLPIFRDSGHEDAMVRLSQRYGLDLGSHTEEKLKTWGLATTRLEADVETTKRQLSSLMASHRDSGPLHPDFFFSPGDDIDYAWVQFREMASDSWQDIHPAMPVGLPVEDLVPRKIYADSIDRDLQHEFRFQVFIEKRINDRTESVPLMEPWVRPAANLHGELLMFTNLASDLIGLSDLEKIDEAIASSDVFFPVLNGDLLPNAFDRFGNLIPADVAGSPYAGVFEQVSKKTSQAAAAVGALGSSSKSTSGSIQQDSEPMALARQWIEYTLVSPDGMEKRFRRTIFDESRGLGSDGDSSPTHDLQNVHALSDQVSFMLSTGGIPEAYLADATLARLLKILAFQRSLLKAGELDHHGMAKLLQDHLSTQDLSRAGLLALYALFDRGAELPGIAYRAEPSLVAHRQQVRASGTGRVTVDIINNPRIAVRQEAGITKHSFDGALSAGIWESFAEGVQSGQSGQPVTAAGLVQESARQGAQLLTVTPERQALLADISLPNESRQAIEQDLEDGYVVIVPSDSFGREWAWWRIDPNTGTSLARSGEGIGSSATEYVIGLIVVAVFVIVAISAFLGCFNEWDQLNKGPNRTQKSIKLTLCGLCALFAGAVAAIGVYVSLTTLAAAAVAPEIGVGFTFKQAAFWDLVAETVSQACGAVGWVL